jgi:MFS transporter, ACS family, D-galactonate transporter
LTSNGSPIGHGFRANISAFSTLPWGQLRLISSVAFLSVAAMMNLAPLLPLIKMDLVLSDTWLALLTSATILTHTLLQMLGGQMTDSLGVRRTVWLGVTFMGVGVLASGFAPSLILLFFCRLAIGVGTALSFVAGLTFTHRVVPAKRRVLGQSVFGAAASLGILVILLTSERLASLGGWRTTLVLEGLFILAFGWYVASRLSDDGSHAGTATSTWGEAIRQRIFYLLGLAHVITYGVFIGLTTWVVTFLYRDHGIGLEWAGPLAALFALSAIGGRLLGGVFSVGRERSVIVLSCLISALATTLLPWLPSIALALLVVALFGWFVSVPFGAIFSFASVASGRPVSGREISVINFIANLGALAFPPLVGLALDLTGSFVVGFGVLGGIGLVGTAVLALALPTKHR